MVDSSKSSARGEGATRTMAPDIVREYEDGTIYTRPPEQTIRA